MLSLKECYKKMGSNFEAVFDRLGSEAIIKKYAIKFLDDPSYDNLIKAYNEGNKEEAFRAVHTLKGICLNLGFDTLYQASFDLTEVLRNGELVGSENLLDALKVQYQVTVDAIKLMED